MSMQIVMKGPHLHGGASYHEINPKKMLTGIPGIFIRLQKC
jgi:hypothetical protein